MTESGKNADLTGVPPRALARAQLGCAAVKVGSEQVEKWLPKLRVPGSFKGPSKRQGFPS